jgi:hypothetical protein
LILKTGVFSTPVFFFWKKVDSASSTCGIPEVELLDTVFVSDRNPLWEIRWITPSTSCGKIFL